jgi:aminoglycoside phosphotransferase (APT) family kinase protein
MKPAPLLHSGHGWLAGILPDGATRFRVADGAIATTLAHAGAELVDRDPDVELGRAERMRGDADVCIVPLGASMLDVDWRLRRAARRLTVSMGVRAQAARARHLLAERGYVHAATMVWDVGQPLRRAGAQVAANGLVGRLPQRGAVIAARAPLAPTALEAVIAEAQRESGIDLGAGPPVVREGLLVMPAETAFLRLAIGPARLQLDRQFEILTRLQGAPLPASVLDRIPWPHGRGRRKLVDWSVERRLPGRTPRPQLAPALVDDCVDFLVDLHSSTAAPAPAASSGIVSRAEVVAAACQAEEARVLARLAAEAEHRLAGFPRGFGHGDFYRGNLLVEEGRLVGVVDWDTATPESVPYLDLFHLRVFSEQRPADHRWGAVVTEYLLPLAQSGGDRVMREYGRRIGVEASAAELEALVVAYWVDRLAYQLGTVADRLVRERWLTENVHRAVRVLSEVISR